MADVPRVLAEELREAIDLSTTSSDIFIMRATMEKAADYLESISVPVEDEEKVSGRTKSDLIHALNGCVRVGSENNWTVAVPEQIVRDVIASLRVEVNDA